MGGVSKSIRSNTKLLSYLTRQEREELEAILLATPEPMTIIYQIVRPDGSTQGYLLHTPEGYVEMAPDGGCKNFCVNGHLAGNCRPVRKEL